MQPAPSTAVTQARVRVETVADLDSLRALAAMLDTTWRKPRGESLVPVAIMRALAHSGSYVAAAYLGDRIVGGSIGFLSDLRGARALHSHVLGVAAEARDQGVGTALKQHQRGWARARGLTRILWTFDPLVRRNAHLNLNKLGATSVAYEVDFYGALSDGINAGDESDRLLVAWPVDGDGAVQNGRDPQAGALILDVAAGGEPVIHDHDLRAPVLRCRIPADIEALRAADPVLARTWRLALRRALTGAIAAGHTAVAMSPDGCYVLETCSSSGGA
jgi:predicted GNAT superfamily acetyltransferase